MIWHNYLAPTTDTPLDKNSIVTSEELGRRLAALGAGSMYHCYYDLEKRDTFVGYEGLMKPVFNTIYIDLDDDETKGELAWMDAKAICQLFRENNIDFTLYFSGNKGFHICINMHALGISEAGTPKQELEQFVKAFLFGLKETYKTVDTRIWNANRKFRAAGSRHEKSGLYKTLLFPGRKVSNLTLSDIRELAKLQRSGAMVHPNYSGEPSKILTGFVDLGKTVSGNTTYSGKKSEIKEVAVGLMIDDPSMKYRTLKKKPCIEGMVETRNPNFNRHDIGLRIITDLHATGASLEDAVKKIDAWAVGVYAGDTERVRDSVRMVHDTYSKPQDYRFGCYDEVKQAYCSAKCKIYKVLDAKKRASPLDVTTKQSLENAVRDNPSLEKSEGELADELLLNFGNICKASGEYFKWIGTHWEMVDRERFEYSINQMAIGAYLNGATTKQIKSLADHVKMKITVAPQTNHFFSASLNKFNFTDCTAVVSQIGGKITLETKPHDPADMLATCRPFPLKADHKLSKSDSFKHYMQMRTEDLGPDGVRIIKQMLGASLIPFVPRIFFIEGATNSGKSTLGNLLIKLLGAQNVSGVQPTLQTYGGNRFTWEPSIGKIANIVLELDRGVPIDVNTLKLVRDKVPIAVDRKNKAHVPATLPFFHVYCCNQMPASLEGNSGALNNRVTLLHFKPQYLNGLGGIMDLGTHIWETDAGGVLEAAREGLQDLIDSGFKYFESDTSKDSVKNWQTQTDTVELFFEDLRIGEWPPPPIESKDWEKGSIFYASYKEWAKDSNRKCLGKQAFYNAIEQKTKVDRKARGQGGVRFDFRPLLKCVDSEQSVILDARNADREPSASPPSY